MVEPGVEYRLHVLRRVYLDAREHPLPRALRRRRHLVERFAADLAFEIGLRLLARDERETDPQFALHGLVREPPAAEVRQLVSVLGIHAVGVYAAFGERGAHAFVESAYPCGMRRGGERIGAPVGGGHPRHVRRSVQPRYSGRLQVHAHLAPIAHPDGRLSRQNEAEQVFVGRIEAQPSYAVRARHRHEVERPERHACVRLHAAVLRPLSLRADQRIDEIKWTRPRDRRDCGKHNQ